MRHVKDPVYGRGGPVSAKNEALSEENSIRKKLDSALRKLNESESEISKLTSALAEKVARKNQFDESLNNLCERNSRLTGEAESLREQLQSVWKRISGFPDPELHQVSIEKLENRIQTAEGAIHKSERCAQMSLKIENKSRSLLTSALSELERIETEAQTLSQILDMEGQDLFPAIIDKVKVKQGFETAPGAALGADLDISTDASAPIYWNLKKNNDNDPPLPEFVQPLSEFVKGPPELNRRLAQIGVTDNDKAVG